MNKKQIIIILLLVFTSCILFIYFIKDNFAYTLENSGIININKNLNGINNINKTEKIEQNTQLSEKKKNPVMEFAFIPLNTLNNRDELEFFYESLKIEYGDKIDKVFIITKNEFDDNISSTPIKSNKLTCYQTNCINLYSVADLLIKENNNFLKKQTEHFNLINHKIGEHFEFLEKYLNDKEISLLFLKPNDFENVSELRQNLNQKYKDDSILFLSISDFSEMSDNKYAELHNSKTFYTLNNTNNIEDYSSIEVSCPSCLYLTNSLALDNQKYPHEFRNNKNIIFYHKNKKENNGITINFFGDLMFDRNVSLYIKNETQLDNFFSDFFQNNDTSLELSEFKIRKLFGIDFVGANLETPVVKDKNECEYSTKSIQFCSKNDFLPWIKKYGFNVFSLANNHSMDGGLTAHKSTINNLKENGLNYFGYIRHGSYFEENYVYTGSIRGIDFAWHSYDFTITKYLIDDYCESLKQFKQNGYVNFVTPHWGDEYKTIHNKTQEGYAHKLIDCGADLIIGHHPHVIQDIGWYKEKPIIYSLGNFVFDQDWSENTQKGIGVLIDYNINGNIRVETEERNVCVKK